MDARKENDGIFNWICRVFLTKQTHYRRKSGPSVFLLQGTRLASTDVDIDVLLAVQDGNLKEASRLLTLGAQINVCDQMGETALHHAANDGDDAMVRFLLANEASVTRTSAVIGFTPLHCAAQKGHDRTVSLLLAAGADPMVKTAFTEKTPYDLANENGHRAAARRLSPSVGGD